MEGEALSRLLNQINTDPNQSLSDWSYQFFRRAVSREIYLDDDSQHHVNELREEAELQVEEAFLWFLGLPAEEQAKHTAGFRAALVEVMRLREENSARARAYLLRVHGVRVR